MDNLDNLTREQAISALKQIREVLFPADDVEVEWDAGTVEEVSHVIVGFDPQFDKPENRTPIDK